MSDDYDDGSLDSYDFGGGEAPTGFNPDEKGFRQIPPGVHTVKVASLKIATDHVFRVKDDQFILNQLQPILEVVDGPHAGATILDFLPIPTPGQPMPTRLANQWGNFVKSLGFDLPAGKMVPAGFTVPSMKGRTCQIEVEAQFDRDGNAKLYKGQPQNGVKMFGYSRVGTTVPQSTTPAAKAATTTAPQKFEL